MCLGSFNWSVHHSRIGVLLYLFAETEIRVETWEDEEDEYLAQAVYEHMQLNDKQVSSCNNLYEYASIFTFYYMHKNQQIYMIGNTINFIFIIDLYH